MDALTFAQVEHLDTVVPQGTDEQSFSGRIEVEMIDSPFNSGERNCLLELQRFPRRLTGHEIVADCYD